MHHATSAVLLAIMASGALAVPTPSKPHAKGSFKVPVKGHGQRSPADEIAYALRKHGWDVEKAFSLPSGFAWPSQWRPIAFPSASSAASYASYASYASASSFPIGAESSGFAFPSVPVSSGFASSAPASGIPYSVGAPSSAPASSIPFSSGAPSSAPASSEAPAPSSGPASSEPSASSASSAPSSSPSSGGSGGSGTGEVPADPEAHDQAYTSPVTIGGQKLNLDFDTGSSDLWVFSSELPASDQSGHSIYNPSKSSTYSPYKGGSWQIKYGDGSTASGNVGFDIVNVGGAIVKKQCVELAEHISKQFREDQQSDGLMGLGFSNLNQVQPKQQNTFFENVMNDLNQPLFTADLDVTGAGEYEFGAIDSSKYTGTLHYTAVDSSQGHWQFASQSYTIGGSRHSCTTCSPTLADTGTSIILLDQDIVEAYYNQVNGVQNTKDGYLYPCSATLPDFGIAVGEYIATIKGSDMTYLNLGKGTCMGALQSNLGAGVNILGDALLKYFFVVFDGGNLRLGIAPKSS